MFNRLSEDPCIDFQRAICGFGPEGKALSNLHGGAGSTHGSDSH